MQVSELYHIYEKEFTEGCERLQLTDCTEASLPALEQFIKELTTTQRQLDVELCALPTSIKAGYEKALKPFKKILSDKKLEVKKLQRSSQSVEEISQQSFREKSEQNDRLSQSKRLLYGMEAMSEGISDTLVGQTEKLIGMQEKNKEVQGLLEKANSLVDSMWFKQKKNKLILGALAAAIVLFIVYRML